MLMIFSLQDDVTEGERMRKVLTKEFESKTYEVLSWYGSYKIKERDLCVTKEINH